MEYKGIDWLKNKLVMKKARVKLRYDFYEQKHTAVDFGISPLTMIVESALHSPASPFARTRALIVRPSGGTMIPPSTFPAFA